MDVEINPEPRPEERKAIEFAVRQHVARPKVASAYSSAWWRAGLPDSAEIEEDYPRTAKSSQAPGTPFNS